MSKTNEELAARVAETLCPDIGNPMDPGARNVREKAKKVVLEALEQVALNYENEIRSLEIDYKQADQRIITIQRTIDELLSQRDNWRLSSVCREKEARIKELENLLEHERTAKETARLANTEAESILRGFVTNTAEDDVVSLARRAAGGETTLRAARNECERQFQAKTQEVLDQMHRAERAESERDDMRAYHEDCLRDAYKQLGIEDDGELRYKWVGLALAELRRDKERLDWLDTHFTVFTLNHPTLRGQPVRVRLDAAMKESS